MNKEFEKTKQRNTASKQVIQVVFARNLIFEGRRWMSNVWLGEDYEERDKIIGDVNRLIGMTNFKVGRGFQPSDPVVRPARKYTTIVADLERDAERNADFFRQFLNNEVHLEYLPPALQELGLITCFAEVGRGYSSSLNDLICWIEEIENRESSWSDVKTKFAPSLTYDEDSRTEWQQ